MNAGATARSAGQQQSGQQQDPQQQSGQQQDPQQQSGQQQPGQQQDPQQQPGQQQPGADDHRAKAAASGIPGAGDVRLDPDSAERVLRRAVELDARNGEPEHRISLQALLDAADELGIDASDVHRAVHEEQIGVLGRRARRTDRLLGPDSYVAVRIVDGPPERLAALLDEWLRRGGVLRRTRTVDGSGALAASFDYARRTDAVAGVQRALRSAVGSERLAHVRRVRAVVGDLGDGRCAVGLVVDASRSRANAAAGATATTVTGTAASLALLGQTGVYVAAAVGVAASVGAGIGIASARRAWTAGVPEELDSVLDAVASGRRPASLFSRPG